MVTIQQSANDKRLYKHITLDNGLQAVLISDPDMQVSSSEEIVDTAMGATEEDGGRHHIGHGHHHHHDDDCACCEEDEGEEDESSGDDEESEGSEADSDHECLNKRVKAVKKAAAALAVNVGSFSDPADVQGMSHYLEHMLFMGSEKFPDENEYDSYLASHGGASNAFTEMEFTNYHFDVSPAHLRGALERFAQFFIEPLCKADALDREVQAVNNEFTGVRQNDEARLAQLRSHTANPGHLYRKFTWGNAKSLVEDPKHANIDVRHRLIDYYKQEYSAERMRLSVLGSEPLEVLESWVKELFSHVPSGKGPKPDFQGLSKPYQKAKLYLLSSVKEAHTLVMTFQLPSLLKRYLAKAEDYLSTLIGHEGSGSLLSLLKAKGLASGLSSGVSDSGFEKNTGLYLFDVQVELTEFGLQQQNGLAVVQYVFEYLAMLRREGPQQWVYQELADIGNMRAKFKEEIDAADYVAEIVSTMLYVKPEHTLVADDLFQDWDPQLVTDLLNEMVPSNCRLDLQTSRFNEMKASVLQLPNAAESIEPWFELPYVEADVPESLRASWENAGNSINKALHLPPRNEFIPTDFSLMCETESVETNGHPQKKQKQENGNGMSVHSNGTAVVVESDLGPTELAPEKVIDENGLRLWYLLDSTFRTPRSVVNFIIASQLSYKDARTAAMTSLALRLLVDSSKETTYLAEVAGLGYSLWSEGKLGVEVKVSGFSHKLPLLVSTIMKTLSTFKASSSNFERIKEMQVLKFRNANIHVQQHASYLRLRCIKQLWDVDDVLKHLEELTVEDLQAFVPEIWRSTFLECMIEGNSSPEQARQLAKSMAELFPDQKMTAESRKQDFTAHIQPGTSFLLRQPAKNKAEENSALEVYFQCGPDSIQSRAELDLIEQILSEPSFNVLRTKEQLGYSVHCGVRLTNNVLGFAFTIVSGSHDPQHCDDRVEAFLSAYLTDLQNMSDQDFDENREALINAKLEKDNCLQDQADRHWDQILNRRYKFHSRLEEVEILRDITRETIVKAYNKFLVPGSKQRARLAVQIFCQKHASQVEASKLDEGITLIDDPEKFRSSLPAYSV